MLEPLYISLDITISHMTGTENRTTIYLRAAIKKKIDDYAEAHDISRSSMIKIAVSEFFLKQGGTT